MGRLRGVVLAVIAAGCGSEVPEGAATDANDSAITDAGDTTDPTNPNDPPNPTVPGDPTDPDPPGAPPMTAPVMTFPSTIGGGATCSASFPEVSAKIQAWLDSVPDGYNEKLIAGRCYHVEHDLVLAEEVEPVLDVIAA